MVHDLAGRVSGQGSTLDANSPATTGALLLARRDGGGVALLEMAVGIWRPIRLVCGAGRTLGWVVSIG